MPNEQAVQAITRDDRHPEWWAELEAMAIREAQERREREHEAWLAKMRAAGLLQ